MGALPVVARAGLHKWEEPCISGEYGSGTVFFSGCNMKCIFCQNHIISHGRRGREITVARLAEIYQELQGRGAHNINLVNPTHFIPAVKSSLEAAAGLTIPVVYNTNGYESAESLGLMNGLVDVYLPDLKYFSPDAAGRYSGAGDYFSVASTAVEHMYRQVGKPIFDEKGMLKRGLIIRHLILPGMTGESIKVLDWIKYNLPSEVYISLMSQYIPYHKAIGHPVIGRKISRREYDRVINHLFKLGLENGYVQERQSADEKFVPAFDLEGV